MDSRYLLEQILAELRKKPGPWDVILVPANKNLKVPHGEVWEIYVACPPGDVGYLRQSIKGGTATYVTVDIVNDSQMWFPRAGIMTPDVVVEWTQTGAVFEATNSISGTTNTYMAPEGHIFCGDEEFFYHTGVAQPAFWLRKFVSMTSAG